MRQIAVEYLKLAWWNLRNQSHTQPILQLFPKISENLNQGICPHKERQRLLFRLVVLRLRFQNRPSINTHATALHGKLNWTFERERIVRPRSPLKNRSLQTATKTKIRGWKSEKKIFGIKTDRARVKNLKKRRGSEIGLFHSNLSRGKKDVFNSPEEMQYEEW